MLIKSTSGLPPARPSTTENHCLHSSRVIGNYCKTCALPPFRRSLSGLAQVQDGPERRSVHSIRLQASSEFSEIRRRPLLPDAERAAPVLERKPDTNRWNSCCCQRV